MQTEADDVICLEEYPDFGAIGFYYLDFRQVSDEEVIEILARFPVGGEVNGTRQPTLAEQPDA
jgi:predicted phosphoribosyltransferase